jgi:hypothetical protein
MVISVSAAELCFFTSFSMRMGLRRSAGRLTLTNHALYFEAIGVDFSYGEAVVYDLARDLKQSVKRESTGPWGAHLFDKAVMYKSSLT